MAFLDWFWTRDRNTSSPESVVSLAHEYFPSFLRQRERTLVLEGWIRNTRETDVYVPKGKVGPEYTDLVSRSPSPWGSFIIKSLTQTFSLEGAYAARGSLENMDAWQVWQENGFDARQGPLYEAACGHGLAFVYAKPALSPASGGRSAYARPVSALKMAAFYEDDGEDEWPEFTIRAEETAWRLGDNSVVKGWRVRLLDGETEYHLRCKGDGLDRRDWEYIRTEAAHGAGVCPVVRYAPYLDIDGNAHSELDPIIPLLRRIDQDTFDRLIVQRYGAWKVRYIAGMAEPENEDEATRAAIKLSLQDILILEDPQGKAGTLDETQLDGFIKARDADLRDLSAVTQTPPHHMLGLSSNLQAESLAAAETGLQRKGDQIKVAFGESSEQVLRLMAKFAGNEQEARAYDMQVRWRDTGSRSLAQAAQALAQFADSLGVPKEMLWERIPGWTDSDTERAKQLVQAGGVDAMIEAVRQLAGNPGAQEGETEEQEPDAQSGS